MDELAEIFADLGFAVATGPEIEDDWHNFTALNMDETHPARAMHDTFYFPDQTSEGREILLRTHTSPVQIRSMLAQGGRSRLIAPGRVYRSGQRYHPHADVPIRSKGWWSTRISTSATWKWTLETFFKAFFEREDIVLRLRPSYFPFTEPSVEVDVGYSTEGGRRVVGGHGDAPGHAWMELGGSGMVNCRVRASGIDPEKYQGFAFGMGIDRIAMLKYGIPDLRAFFEADLRWLRHYGFGPFDQPTLSAGVGARA